MATKVYELKRLAAGKLTTRYKGTEIDLDFTYGRGSYGANKAELLTRNQFVQEAIENDPRFGSMFRLAAIYQDEAEEKVEEEVKMVYNNAGRMFIPYVPEAEEAKEEEQPAEEKPKKQSKKKEAVKKAVEIPEVTTLNDAYDWFAQKGMVIESKEELQSACEKVNVAFPNLEI